MVDAGGMLAGMLSRRDIFQAISQQALTLENLQGSGVSLELAGHADKVMLRDIPTASPDIPLEQVIKLMGNSAVVRVAVVDGHNRLLGLISDKALLGAFAQPKPWLWDFLMLRLSPPELDWRHQELIRRSQKTRAEQVMKWDFASAGEDTPLEEEARLMTEKRIKRLPVLNAQGRLLGMLSREALLRLGAASI
ncbi:hypothetical protein DFAR_1040004 [Desulfarculales bacterium]